MNKPPREWNKDGAALGGEGKIHRKKKTQQQTIFLGSSNKLNMLFGGLYSITLVQRKTKNKIRKREGGRGEFVPSFASPLPRTVGAAPQLGQYLHSSTAYPRTLSIKR